MLLIFIQNTVYPDVVLAEYPFRTRFIGDVAVDLGGGTRDVFSAFFEEAYIQCFDSSSLLTPSDNPFLDPGTISILTGILTKLLFLA